MKPEEERVAGLGARTTQDKTLPETTSTGAEIKPETRWAKSDDAGFIKAVRGDDGLELLRANKNAFCLLYVIALRACRRSGFNRYGLKPGQALIGDWKACGMTRQEYRTAVRVLETFNFSTFQPTTKGTIATLTGTSVFDINAEGTNQQANHRLTIGQPSPNHRPTTNKKVKKEKKEKKPLCRLPQGDGSGGASTSRNGSPRKRERDPLLEALASLDGSDPAQVTSKAWGAIAASLQAIREVCPDVTPKEVRRRAANYRANNPTWKLTHHALANHWASCDRVTTATSKPAYERNERSERSKVPNLTPQA